MLNIISKEKFKSIPWKNGKGSTLELAINPNGSLNDFEWRLSIAKVEEDGAFSDFTGYTRNLVLIDGEGIVLHHHEKHIDHLNKKLEFSTFDGANMTIAKLTAGTITDFNLMTRTTDFNGTVKTYSGTHEVVLDRTQICFIYGLSKNLEIESNDFDNIEILPVGDLMQITNEPAFEKVEINVSGENFIVVYINKLESLKFNIIDQVETNLSE